MGILHGIQKHATINNNEFLPRNNYLYDNDYVVGMDKHNFEGREIVSRGVNLTLSGNRITLCPIRRANKSTFDKRKRSAIVGLSKSSIARQSKYLREACSRYRNIGTLTYPKGHPSAHDGVLAKRDFNEFIKRLKRFVASDKLSLFWFAEIQSNEKNPTKSTNSIHFHFFCTHFIEHADLAILWYRSHSHFYQLISDLDRKNAICAGTGINSLKSGRFGMIAYAAKYAKKESQKIIPECVSNFGRFWGVRGKKDVCASSVKIGNYDQKSLSVLQIEKLDEFALECERKGLIRSYRPQFFDEKTEEMVDTGIEIYEIRDARSLLRIIMMFERIAAQTIPKHGWFTVKVINQMINERGGL